MNVLVSLEAFKAAFGWSDAEMYAAFFFDLQVRYAVGYRNLAEGYFDLRTVYNFRGRLSSHMEATGENLLDEAFKRITDEQIESFQLKTGKLRMDSTQIASNIRQMSRLQLLVEVLQRVHRMLAEADRGRYAERFAPYLKGSSGQYIYRQKGEETGPHMERIGKLMRDCLKDLAPGYRDHPGYQILERVFGEPSTVVVSAVQARTGKGISPSSMQSTDDSKAGQHTAHLEAEACGACPFQEKCPTRGRKREGRRTLKFSRGQADIAQRRQRCAAYRKEGRNLRSAIEATIGAIKRPLPGDQ